MLFSSTIFLFVFLPIVLTTYFALSRLGLGRGLGVSARNALLLTASLLFYAWGETGYVLVLLFSIVVNHLFGLWIDRGAASPARKVALVSAVACNLVLLGVFKYANFFAAGIDSLLTPLGVPAIDLQPVHLPIGISFFTFQAITYVVDVYRREAPVDRNPLRVALYISLFPQLIAGPIVRYKRIASELRDRSASIQDVAEGVRRFTVGLGKKVLIANTLAVPADRIFSLPADEIGAGVAWLGAVCYAMQIYFDFSGYSDMAIGLGRIFGFHFPENFVHPYVARSVREFWRRWHITLSTWFRDYLFIPLGGSRGGSLRTYANLLTVFVLCGLWHGASLTFLVWGLIHGALMVVERVGLENHLARLPRFASHTYTLLAVTAAWVVFRCDSLTHAAAYYGAMLTGGGDASGVHPISLFLDPKVSAALIVAAIASTPWLDTLRARIDTSGRSWLLLRYVALNAVIVACAMALASGTHNPFIYFRF
jgi:alginate O-acetyltransferase complex protein AlgI